MAIVPTDDIIALLAQDHEAIRERLTELEASKPAARAQLFSELTQQLVRHEVAEEVRQHDPEASRRSGLRHRSTGPAECADRPVALEQCRAPLASPHQRWPGHR